MASAYRKHHFRDISKGQTNAYRIHRPKRSQPITVADFVAKHAFAHLEQDQFAFEQTLIVLFRAGKE